MERPHLRHVKRNPETGEREEQDDNYHVLTKKYAVNRYYTLPPEEAAKLIVAANRFVSVTDEIARYVSILMSVEETEGKEASDAWKESHQKREIEELNAGMPSAMARFSIHFAESVAFLHSSGNGMTKAIFIPARFNPEHIPFRDKLVAIVTDALKEYELNL